ncbi:hypothetical protein RF55_6825 [Lasius niger]|uniref:Gag polyprotein n=1 Tax=Lasius niger TaxID=67767 RepID=A0A0J7KRZ4_LASNI|nr:hypothetical protein RF55_6825 [Lasius niger]
MDRAALEKLTVEQLKQEALKYGLSVAGKKADLIETLVSHFQRNAPVSDLLGLAAIEASPASVQAAGPSAGRVPLSGASPSARADPVQQMVAALQGVIRRQEEERADQRRFFQEQQRSFAQLLEVLTTQRNSGATTQNGASARGPPEREPSRSPATSIPISEGRSSWSSGNAIQALASQIPEFAGKEEDNIRTWVRRVEKVAQVHGVSDGVALLAASSRLAGSARRWFDVQNGAAVETWIGLRDELIKMFDQRVPFFKLMERIKARKWQSGKETFDEYAIHKLAIMHRADLAEADQIHLLISSITSPSLRGIALSVTAETVDVFMEHMRRITHGVGEEKKPAAVSATSKSTRDSTCRNCGKKGHGHKDCRGETTCFYCKEKGHRRFDCPLLKKKEAKTQKPVTTSAVAAGVSEEGSQEEVVAAVQGGLQQLVVDDPFITVDSLLGERRKLLALIDTGSPVSFIKNGVYNEFVKPAQIKLSPSNRILKNLSDQSLKTFGTVSVQIMLEKMPGILFNISMFVLNNDFFQADFILGRFSF